MRGSFSRFGAPANRKDPLTKGDLASAVARLRPDNNYDDSLFIAQLLVGFYALLQSGELVVPDRVQLHGSLPTCSWFMARLRRLFPPSIAGHSMRAGRATALAEAGVPPDRIQAAGRWSSEAFKVYIRKHPALLAALTA
ncbi:hypothetical protein CONPUDRAFT_159472 [Coniophora puteana RWD-64-598 SS2]|uniref:Tyr recombinase domain-containing protein n=1 Tax=Coniophora puteana (strain RWD-64-598) TaxID=741705 RepID=A0A5M3M8T9_CONPW|nr:uncharacterized protein CONPUDRAFT_159472 [Coniophora puteana RWD-64-598 SS2]EIW75346.1 hypothetical protein CONPUDRAFT_159472 [Coniophora puteana RWD-64-598 SS2]